MGWISVLMVVMGLLLTGCATLPEGAPSAVDERQPAMDERQEADRLEALRQHSASLARFWQAGEMAQARNQWQAFAGLLLPGEKEEDYLIPAFDPMAFEEMRTYMTTQEERLATLSLPAVVDPQEPSAQQQWLRRELAIILQDFGEAPNAQVPDEFVQEVERFMERFTQDDDMGSWYRLAMARMDKYMPAVRGIFSQRDMPESIFFLALVESAFNPDAVSKAGPVGMWQFMPGTGQKYGLTRKGKQDQRKDPVKSSLAARDYLHDLLMNLGDSQSMLLALAAYNAGEGRILSLLDTLEEQSGRTFWSLFNKGLLPNHTRLLVAKMMAAAVIGLNRERFGLAPGSIPNITTRLVLYQPVPVSYLLEVGEWEKEELARLNPDLGEGETLHPDPSGLELTVPRRVAQRVMGNALLTSALTPPLANPLPRPSPRPSAAP